MLSRLLCFFGRHDEDDLDWGPGNLPPWAPDVQPTPKPDKHSVLYICKRCRRWRWGLSRAHQLARDLARREKEQADKLTKKLGEADDKRREQDKKTLEVLAEGTKKWQDRRREADEMRKEQDKKSGL